jgi:hypothetical protein
VGPTRLPLKGSAWAPSVCSGLPPRRVRSRTRNYLKRLLTKVLPRTRSTELGLKAKMRRVRAPVIPKGWWPSPKALQAHTLSCPTYPLGRRAEDLDSCAPPPPIAQQPTLVRPPRSVRPVAVLPLALAPPSPHRPNNPPRARSPHSVGTSCCPALPSPSRPPVIPRTGGGKRSCLRATREHAR